MLFACNLNTANSKDTGREEYMGYNLSNLYRNLRLKLVNRTALSLPLRTQLGKGTDIACENGIVQIGNHITVRDNVHLSAVSNGKIVIGSKTFINRNCIFVSRKEINIGNNVGFGPNVCIYDHDHCFDSNGKKEGYSLDSVVIEDNCWIGAGCIILKGTHIGKGCVVGAGCVVKGSVPSNSLVTMNRSLEIRRLEDRR